MELKRTQIRLGGISRLPSERMTSDGECWESVNLVADNGETVASRFPSVVEDDGLPPAWETYARLVFVHTTDSYTHYILQESNSIGTWGDGSLDRFFLLDNGEDLRGIASIGNTLVISTSEHMRYVLWKDGAYKYLGTELPKPSVTFYGTERIREGDKALSVQAAWDEEIWMDNPKLSRTADFSLSTEFLRHGLYFCGSEKYMSKSEADDVKEEVMEDARTQAIWNAYGNAVAAGAAYNRLTSVKGVVFMQPHFFRYALRLYDGTYAMQSAPVLVGAGVEWPQVLGDVYLGSSHHDNYKKAYYGFAMVMAYKVRAVLEEAVSGDWSDIIESVDIFCSSPINPVDPGTSPLYPAETFYVTDINDGFDNPADGKNMIETSNSSSDKYEKVTRYGLGSGDVDKLLSYSVFYRIGSFLVADDGNDLDEDYDPAQEFTANQKNLLGGIWLKRPDADALVAHRNTSEDSWDDYECDHYLYGGCLKTMNSRLAMWDVRKTIGTGLPVLCSPMGISTGPSSSASNTIVWDSDYNVRVYEFMWVLEAQGETKHVFGRYLCGGTEYMPLSPSRSVEDLDEPCALVACGWLAYPDAGCKRAVYRYRTVSRAFLGNGEVGVLDSDWSALLSVTMKEHPFLNCAYAWLGFGKYLDENESAASEEDSGKFATGTDGEDREMTVKNRVLLSVVDNPFVFPVSGRYDFDYNVVSAAAANLPISQGQYGEFPLYVFTEGGIYAMQMSSDGTFVSSSPFSRDVALSRETVSEVDRGVVFATVKGVRVIEGGQISDLSALMLGEPLPFPDSLADILADCGFGNGVAEAGAMSAAYTDETPFLSFLEGAECLYDYTGQRLVLVNPDFRFQYVYRMATGSWHKTFLYGAAYGLQTTSCAHPLHGVNSYPKCYVTASSGTGYAVLDLCTALEPARRDDYNDGRTLGLLLTRTMDLGAPDVFKSVRDLRVRGDFPKGDVQYVLLASNNNRDWVVRESLRGPSFRFYRLLLVTRLSEFGRIAYVEMDYEERFSNRLR